MHDHSFRIEGDQETRTDTLDGSPTSRWTSNVMVYINEEFLWSGPYGNMPEDLRIRIEKMKEYAAGAADRLAAYRERYVAEHGANGTVPPTEDGYFWGRWGSGWEIYQVTGGDIYSFGNEMQLERREIEGIEWGPRAVPPEESP